MAKLRCPDRFTVPFTPTSRWAWHGLFFYTKLNKEQRALHAASRLTFGPTADTLAQPASGVTYPGSRLDQSLQQIATLIKADAGLEVAFADTLGWDTHIGQAQTLQGLLSDFAQSLAAFHQDMGARMADVTVITMSERWRTAIAEQTAATPT